MYTAFQKLYTFAMKTSFLMLARRVLPALLLASVCWASVASGAETEESPLIKAMGWKGECDGAPSDMAEFRRLLEAGADPDSCDEDGMPLLYSASENGNPEAVKLLLEFGADTEKRCPVRGEGHAPRQQGRTPLFGAAEGQAAEGLPYGMNPKECMRLLLAAGANVHARDEYGRTPLFYAAGYGFGYGEDRVLMLLAAGADVNALNDLGETPLVYAVKRWDALCISSLCEHGADVSWRDAAGNTLLHLLVKHPPLLTNMASKDAEQWNLREIARYHAAIRALLAAGADPNAANAAGETPLSLAEKSGNAELVELLREASRH